MRGKPVRDDHGWGGASVLEQGDVVQLEGDLWEYQPAAEGRVIAEARDLAGNVVRKEMGVGERGMEHPRIGSVEWGARRVPGGCQKRKRLTVTPLLSNSLRELILIPSGECHPYL